MKLLIFKKDLYSPREVGILSGDVVRCEIQGIGAIENIIE